jgi:hypothetical protein
MVKDYWRVISLGYLLRLQSFNPYAIRANQLEKDINTFFPGVSKAASDNTLNLSVFFKQIQRKKDAISNNTSMHF